MLTKTVSKLWQGTKVSVRDYEVNQAIKKGGMIIIHNNKTMKIPADLLSAFKPEPKVWKSKTGGKDYRLVDIPWNPM
jgi:hypothetical protein